MKLGLFKYLLLALVVAAGSLAVGLTAAQAQNAPVTQCTDQEGDAKDPKDTEKCPADKPNCHAGKQEGTPTQGTVK